MRHVNLKFAKHLNRWKGFKAWFHLFYDRKEDSEPPAKKRKLSSISTPELHAEAHRKLDDLIRSGEEVIASTNFASVLTGSPVIENSTLDASNALPIPRPGATSPGAAVGSNAPPTQPSGESGVKFYIGSSSPGANNSDTKITFINHPYSVLIQPDLISTLACTRLLSLPGAPSFHQKDLTAQAAISSVNQNITFDALTERSQYHDSDDRDMAHDPPNHINAAISIPSKLTTKPRQGAQLSRRSEPKSEPKPSILKAPAPPVKYGISSKRVAWHYIYVSMGISSTDATM